MPNDEPIRKQALERPPPFACRSVSASCSEDRSLPSRVSTQKKQPLGSFARMRSASFCRPWAICVPLGLSGRRHSGSSMSSKSQ